MEDEAERLRRPKLKLACLSNTMSVSQGIRCQIEMDTHVSIRVSKLEVPSVCLSYHAISLLRRLEKTSLRTLRACASPKTIHMDMKTV